MFDTSFLIAQDSAIDAVTASGASNAFFGLDPQQRFILLLVALGCGMVTLISMTGILAGVYSSMVARRELNDLKQDMLDRGMTAEEIAEVIEAAPVADAASRWVKAKLGTPRK